MGRGSNSGGEGSKGVGGPPTVVGYSNVTLDINSGIPLTLGGGGEAGAMEIEKVLGKMRKKKAGKCGRMRRKKMTNGHK